MEFNKLVKERLFPILQRNGFEIAEEFKNIVRFQSSNVKVNVVFNDYDKSHLIEIGKKGDTLYPLNNDAIKKIWGCDLTIERVSSDVFVQNLSLLFAQTEGIEILKGNLKHFEDFITKQSEKYTSEFIQGDTIDHY